MWSVICKLNAHIEKTLYTKTARKKHTSVKSVFYMLQTNACFGYIPKLVVASHPTLLCPLVRQNIFGTTFAARNKTSYTYRLAYLSHGKDIFFSSVNVIFIYIYILGGAVACLSVPQPPLSGTIYKFSGTIFKFSGTIYRFSGTIYKFSGTIYKFSGNLFRISGISGAMYKMSSCMLYDFWWFHESCRSQCDSVAEKTGKYQFLKQSSRKTGRPKFFFPHVLLQAFCWKLP